MQRKKMGAEFFPFMVAPFSQAIQFTKQALFPGYVSSYATAYQPLFEWRWAKSVRYSGVEWGWGILPVQLDYYAIWNLENQMRIRTFWHVRPTQTQIRLRIRAVWSESSLSAWRNFASLAIQNAPSEDSDQTAWMRRLIWIFARRTCPKVHFLTLGFKSFSR